MIAAIASGSSGGTGDGNVSDRQLKTDTTRIRTTPQGLPLYWFRYDGLDQACEGAMAQDVAILHPVAVCRLPLGYLGVDYTNLGTTLRAVA